MATPYAPNPTGSAWQSEMRSVTPATNNTRYVGRYASTPRMGTANEGNNGGEQHYGGVNAASQGGRFAAYNRQDDGNNDPRTPSSTGLIRLSLKKPMGIVFEPMYDPNQPSVQRGVRICDLPRTGAAALSRKLQVGDELLQINETTVSRMTFDEIMDFIIEADPESVNLLFRRPRKETLQARQGVQQKLNAAANKDNPSTVKWEDEEAGDKRGKERKTSSSKKKSSRKNGKRSKKESQSEEEETIQSSVAGEESYQKSRRTRKKSKSRRPPYESESFLDLLIDTICSNSNNVCRDAFRKHDDDFSDDDESLESELDEETYTTYDESLEPKRKGHKKKQQAHDEYDDDTDDKEPRHLTRSVPEDEPPAEAKKYEDDGTLETVDTSDRAKEELQVAAPATSQPPLGLAPDTDPDPLPIEPVVETVPENEDPNDREEASNPAPIKELEYDDRIDHGADVSVMDSLGGPSLLIDRNRAVAQPAQKAEQTVPSHIIEEYGFDYPTKFGMSREESIQSDPLMFYAYVVKQLLEAHEPEKVRLLDKLLAKYKGRENHLVQKLSVRYNQSETPEEAHDEAFTDAVKKNKSSLNAAAAVSMAQDRMHSNGAEGNGPWIEKEHKEPELEDEEVHRVENGEDDENSESGSDYSRESVDGTSPAVIAQVSELLNYVYGKTSVPGQIDRVSTIMRAYEGREAVLLELLETKALIKANKEKENAGTLPSFLRNSHMSQAHKNAEELGAGDSLPPVTPLATQAPGSGTVINDDISSMSGVSSPALEKNTSINRKEMVSSNRHEICF